MKNKKSTKKSTKKSEKMAQMRLAIEKDEKETQKTLSKYGVSKKQVMVALMLSIRSTQQSELILIKIQLNKSITPRPGM